MDRGRPNGTPKPPQRLLLPADEDRDPAMGAKVSRCGICGMPASESIVGRWSGNGRTYRLVVCAHCLGADRPPDPDPLTIVDNSRR